MLEAIADFVYNVKRVFWGVQPQEMAPQVPLVYRYTKSDAKSLRMKYSKMHLSAMHDLGLPKEEFIRVSTPILKWLSEYLIYLPASEHYHHIEPGAFYLHCIQTANKAAQIAGNNSSLFFNVATEDRGQFQRNFTFAAWLGGLIHDVGKPIADMSVYAVDRDQVWIKKVPVWNPLDLTLDGWAKKNRVRWYRAVFRRNMEIEHHESYVVTFVEKIIDMVNETSFDKRMLLDFLIGINVPTSKIYTVVKKADEMSSQHDIQRYDKVGVFNTPISHFVRALVDYEFEHTKQKRKPYFRSEIGIHINYPTGLNTIIEYMFSRMDKDDISFLKIHPDANFWVEMLRNHRFLVANVDAQERAVGGFRYIAPYIFDIQTIDDEVEQTHTCITMTRDNRVPLNVEELELKRVNIVKVIDPATSFEQNSSQEINSPKVERKKVAVKVSETELSDTISTENIVIKEAPAIAKSEQYISQQVLTEIDNLDFDVPEIDTEIKVDNEPNAKSHDDVVLTSPADDKGNVPRTNEHNTSQTHRLNQEAESEDSIGESLKSPKENLAKLYLNSENRVVKEIARNYSEHIILQCCLEDRVWEKNPELIMFLIFVYEYFKLKDSIPLSDLKYFTFGVEGVSFRLNNLVNMITEAQRPDVGMALTRHISSQVELFIKNTENTENPLYKEYKSGDFWFNVKVAKMVCFPIKDQLKVMLDDGTLVL